MSLELGATTPTREEFAELDSPVVPVTRRLLADSETAVGIYRKLARNRPGTVLLESAEQGKRWSRYSFVGVRAAGVLTERDGATVWLGVEGASVAVHVRQPLTAAAAAAGGDGTVTAPMPGTVTVVKASVGDQVEAGTPLLVVEAMKMEHVLTAPIGGTVTELGVTAGQQVRLDERLAVVTPAAAGEGE